MDGGVKFTFSSGGGGRSMDNARAEELFRQFFSQGDPFRSADDPFDDIFAGLSGLRRSTGAPRADVLPHGTPVRLCDLSQANFNGASGTIDQWDEARGRYVVSLAEGGSLAVRSQNMSQVVAEARVVGTSQPQLNGKVAAAATFDRATERTGWRASRARASWRSSRRT